MARPKKIGVESFPLDCILSEKIDMLHVEHGNAGFVVWIKILQRIYMTENGEYNSSDVLRRKTLSSSAQINLKTLDSIINTMLEIDIFDKNRYKTDMVLTSDGIKKRFKNMLETRLSGAERAKLSYENKQNNSSVKNTRRTDNSSPKNLEPPDLTNSLIYTINSTSKDKKEKSIREIFIPPTIEEVKAYYLEKNSTIEEAEYYWNKKEANGWLTGKDKMKKWKADANNWIKGEWGKNKGKEDLFSQNGQTNGTISKRGFQM